MLSFNGCDKKDHEKSDTGLDKFVIATNINSGSTPLAYVGTFKDLSVGSYTNSKAQQTTTYPFLFVYNDEVYIIPNRAGDIVKKYKRNTDGTLAETGSLTLPASAQSNCIAFESSTKAYCSLTNAGKIAVFNPSSMSITGYIDLTSYAIGDASPDPTVMALRNGKLYVACPQTSNGYTSSNPAQVLIIDVANGNTIVSATDTRTTYAGNSDTKTSMFFTENGDLYVFCVASWGYAPGQKCGFLRIKSGQPTFDNTYFFNVADYNIAGIPGNHVDYLQHPYYGGNGMVYSCGNIPALASNPPDYVHDFSFGSFKVDIVNQTITKLNFPYSNSYSASVHAFENKILYGLSTATGVGIYTYDPAGNVTSPNPVVTTQGDPGVIEIF
jgi:hypothetical protein